MHARGLPREGVFVSYARADGEGLARALQQRLATEAPDIQVWLDRLELEGGAGWWNQIEQQLDRVEFLLLVMSPAAMKSENTRREWRAARQRGVCVYPVKGVPDAELDYGALPQWMRKAHFYEPDLEWSKLLAHLRRGCRATRVPFMAPPLPPTYVARPRETEALERLILGDDASGRPTTTLRGPGGFGKTSLAAAFCHQDKVIEAFDDGVLWVTLGQTPNLLAELLKVYGALTGERPGFVDVEDAARELANRLEGKSCLLVLDDAWNVAHVRPFLMATGPSHLITTRVFEVAMGGARVDVDRMEPDESLRLLLSRADVAPADLEPYRRLAARLGDWPLMLKLVGSAIRQRVARGDTPERAVQFVERGIDKHGVTAFDRDAGDGGAALGPTVDRSLGLLDPDAQVRCTELAVFPEDDPVPLSAVAALWQLDDHDTEELARRLDDLALVEFDLRRGTVRLHDVLRSLLLKRLADPPAVHGRLVSRWFPRPGPHDAYAWRNLAYHLRGAGQAGTLRGLLMDPEWLAAKLEATDVYSLLADFEGLEEDAAPMLVRDALRLSAAALTADPRQLPTQLLVRLMARAEPEIVQLLDAVRGRSDRPLLLPLHPTFDVPGGMLTMTLLGHQRAVTALAFTTDRQTLLSASEDGAVRAWTAEGMGLSTLHVHALGVRSIAVDRSGNTAICGSADGRLYVLDLSRGVVSARLWDEPRHAVNAVALSADGRIAMCGGRAPELRIWDLFEQRITTHLNGHEERITSVAISADGVTAVSGSEDGTVRVWDVGSGALVHTLRGHAGQVRCIALSADARIVLSGSTDRTLRVWSIESGACLTQLLGHEAGVTAVDLSDDGQHALSGSSNRMVNLWHVGQGRLLRQFLAHGDAVSAVRFGHSAATAATASTDRSIKLWRLDEPSTPTYGESHEGAVNALAFSPDGRICASADAEGSIKLWDVATGRCMSTLGPPSTTEQTLAFTPDGRCVMAGSGGGMYRLWFIDTGESVWQPIRHHAPVDHHAFSANARHLVTACADRFVYLWDASSGSLLARYGTRRLFDHLIKPAPRRSASEPSEALLDVYLPGEPIYQVSGVALSDDGSFAAISALPVRAGSMRGTSAADKAEEEASILVLDIETGELHTVATGQVSPVDHFGIDAGGRYIAWAAADLSLQVWDRVAGKRMPGFIGHRDRVQAVAVAAGRGLGVSASLDRSVRVWRLDSGEPVASLIGDSPMRALRLSPDQGVVAVGDASGRVHLLRLPEEIKAAGASPSRSRQERTAS